MISGYKILKNLMIIHGLTQNQTQNVCYQYFLYIKIKVICIICIKFLITSGLFSNILTIYK